MSSDTIEIAFVTKSRFFWGKYKSNFSTKIFLVHRFEKSEVPKSLIWNSFDNRPTANKSPTTKTFLQNFLVPC